MPFEKIKYKLILVTKEKKLHSNNKDNKYKCSAIW
jgi:hypothetical protein